MMEQSDVVFTNNINDIVHDPEIELVVEVMGGITTAYEYVRACLLAKKSVVTANKNLIAVHGVELTTLAKLEDVYLYYEASVGGEFLFFVRWCNTLKQMKWNRLLVLSMEQQTSF